MINFIKPSNINIYLFGTLQQGCQFLSENYLIYISCNLDSISIHLDIYI